MNERATITGAKALDYLGLIEALRSQDLPSLRKALREHEALLAANGAAKKEIDPQIQQSVDQLLRAMQP